MVLAHSLTYSLTHLLTHSLTYLFLGESEGKFVWQDTRETFIKAYEAHMYSQGYPAIQGTVEHTHSLAHSLTRLLTHSYSLIRVYP